MPDNIQLLKYRQSALGFLRFLFGAMGSGKLPDFLKSDEFKRFIHEMHDGQFGGKLPDGQPGSKIPGTGRGILDIVHEIFDSMGFNPGETDLGSGDVNPAAGDRDQTHVSHDSDGFHVNTELANGRGSDRMSWYNNGNWVVENIDRDGNRHTVESVHDQPDGGFRITNVFYDSHGNKTFGYTDYFDSHGHKIDPVSSPGEDGGADTNSSNNPLHNLNILGPGSIEHIGKTYEHPDKNNDKLDPNNKTNPLTEADKERLGRTVPVIKNLDTNSGIDPLTRLNIDPEKMKHLQNEDNKELDQNTGRKPNPVKNG